MISSEKSKLSREVREYRSRRLEAISGRMTEDAALILAFLAKTAKKASNNYGKGTEKENATVEDIARETGLKGTRVRGELRVLVITGFVSKDSAHHANGYAISEDGIDVSNLLLDEYAYPGRKIKITSILNKQKKG